MVRDGWMARIGRYNANELVFLDESAANERTSDRKYGWAPRGVRAAEYLPIKRSERWSILPAYTTNGYLTYEIYQGSFNTLRFNAFVAEKLLPLMQPYPAPRSVIVLDNAHIHRNQGFGDMCAVAGVRIEYLPPYSPDSNPIEKPFAGLKMWMQKNRDLVIAFGVDFRGFLFTRWRFVQTMLLRTLKLVTLRFNSYIVFNTIESP